MPFTLSHPFAIIPLARYRLVFSALVVGSLSPDFLYFINLAPQGQFGHTVLGCFLFCLPIGMLVLWVFHALLKWPIITLLPHALQERLVGPAHGFSFLPGARFLLVMGSILIGAFTHILWDSFTHEYGWAVYLLPFLNYPVIALNTKTLPLFKLLQHSSTVVGSGLILFCLIRWMNQAAREDVSQELRRSAKYKLSWSVILIIGATIFGAVSVWWGTDGVDNPRELSLRLSRFVIGVLSGLFMELVLFSFYWQFSRATGRLAAKHVKIR